MFCRVATKSSRVPTSITFPFKILPSNKWLNCAEFEKTLCSLLREETLGEFIASAPSTDEIDSLIAYHTY